MGFALYPHQNAAALTSTMDCTPNCFDKILDHLTEAQDEIDESDFSGLEVELAKAKSLLNQLKQTTN
jgi:flagellin-specific chaperone FliS